MNYVCRQCRSPTGLLVYEDTTRLIKPGDHSNWRECEVQAASSIQHQAIEVPDEKEN